MKMLDDREVLQVAEFRLGAVFDCKKFFNFNQINIKLFVEKMSVAYDL